MKNEINTEKMKIGSNENSINLLQSAKWSGSEMHRLCASHSRLDHRPFDDVRRSVAHFKNINYFMQII